MATQQEILAAQVAAGACQLGSEPGYCKMGDGSEVGCNFIRECAPNLHFEYASGSGGKGSGNANIWQYQDIGAGGGSPSFVWAGGTIPPPQFAPGFGMDPFSGAIVPVVDYAQYFQASAPAPRVPSTAPTGFTPEGVQTTVSGGGGGSAVAPAYAGGLIERIENYLKQRYGRTAVTQAEFCAAYQVSSGFSCDFNSPDPTTREASAWLVMLQKDQDSRVSVVGNRQLNTSLVPTRSTVPVYAAPMAAATTGMSPLVLAALAVGLVLIVRR